MLPEEAEEALARCDRAVIIGRGEGGAFVADLSRDPDPSPSDAAEEAEAIDGLIEGLLRRQAELLGCSVEEARMR